MRIEDLEQLVAQGESEKVEFKKSTGQRTEAAKAVCAMLNGHGGVVVFGISDRGEIVGQQVSAKTLEDIVCELRKIEPAVMPEIATVALGNEKTAIVLKVTGTCGIYRYDGRPYVRHGPTTQLMPQEEYEKRIVERHRLHRRWESELAPDWVTVQDLDSDEIQVTLRNAVALGRMKAPAHADPESILRGLGLFDDGRLINAAVVLYGKSERFFPSYPQLEIRLARFRKSDRISGFIDNRAYYGHAFSLLRHGEGFLLDRVPIAGRVVPGKMVREDYPLYPPLATREAIANAICHRDYTIHGGAVGVAMYDDRLEIINPGILHFGITPEKLSRPHNSQPWNPIIADVFYRAGIIERWGAGTTDMVEWCRKNGNPAPAWDVHIQSVVVTFLPSTAPFGESKAESGPDLKPESRPESLEDAVLRVLQGGPLSKQGIAHYLGHTSISGGLKKALVRLLNAGMIAYTIPEKPNSRLQKYSLSHPTTAPFGESKAESGPESGPESRPESGPESLEEAVLRVLRGRPLSKQEIAYCLGHTSISGGLKKALVRLLNAGMIAYTIPEKPNSRLQKYSLSHLKRDKKKGR